MKKTLTCFLPQTTRSKILGLPVILGFLALILTSCQPANTDSSGSKVSISFSEDASKENLDGRLLLMFAKSDNSEPRFQINAGLNAQPVFGLNVEGMSAGESISFDDSVFGFPVSSLSELEPGEYQVQALLHVYETFNLSTGHQVKLPMDNGEGQQWNRSPGNLYSKPVQITVAEKGKVENVFSQDKEQMLRIKETFKTDRWADVVGEFAFGINPSARFVNEFLEAEKILGTVHLAFGANMDMPGGKNPSSNHMDLLFSSPTVKITKEDGKKVMILEDGCFKI